MNASSWDMHDTYQALKEAEDRDAGEVLDWKEWLICTWL